MPWRKFMVFNFLGAALWVTVISGAGYLFGQHWERLERNVKRFDMTAAHCGAAGGRVSVVAKTSRRFRTHLRSNLLHECGFVNERLYCAGVAGPLVVNRAKQIEKISVAVV